ncbi:hypothetical protein B0H14DRAFT_2630489 [Mycena olivaceomarginata]|nr:hypothetical protein B0H14DRAFT_2630489 [Mycena olivaceomarginata]
MTERWAQNRNAEQTRRGWVVGLLDEFRPLTEEIKLRSCTTKGWGGWGEEIVADEAGPPGRLPCPKFSPRCWRCRSIRLGVLTNTVGEETRTFVPGSSSQICPTTRFDHVTASGIRCHGFFGNPHSGLPDTPGIGSSLNMHSSMLPPLPVQERIHVQVPRLVSKATINYINEGQLGQWKMCYESKPKWSGYIGRQPKGRTRNMLCTKSEPPDILMANPWDPAAVFDTMSKA